MRTAIKLSFQRSSGTLTGLSCVRREKGGHGHVKFKTSGRACRQSAWTVPSKTDWSARLTFRTVQLGRFNCATFVMVPSMSYAIA